MVLWRRAVFAVLGKVVRRESLRVGLRKMAFTPENVSLTILLAGPGSASSSAWIRFP
jgi:hypothetical protein